MRGSSEDGVTVMRVEILHIDDCPNWREAGERVRAALTHIGATDVTIDHRLISAPGDLRGAPFAGSPTILVQGRDLFPSAGSTSELACRVYVSDGRLAPLPSVDELSTALRARVIG